MPNKTITIRPRQAPWVTIYQRFHSEENRAYRTSIRESLLSDKGAAMNSMISQTLLKMPKPGTLRKLVKHLDLLYLGPKPIGRYITSEKCVE